MNKNHTHDKETLEKIERLLADGIPTGDDLLDSLAAATPQADRAFRQALETRLVNQLQQQPKQRRFMSMLAIHRKPLRFSVSLAAVVTVALVFIAALAMTHNRPPTPSPLNVGPGAGDSQQQATATVTASNTFTPTASDTATQQLATVTPSPAILSPTVSAPAVITATPTPIQPPGSGEYQPVVVALRDIPADSPIRPEAVTVVLWPVETAPVTALSTTEMIASLKATENIAKWQPVLTTRVAFDTELPPGMVAITMPLNENIWGVQAGDRVDVVATMLIIDIDGTYQAVEPDAPAPGTALTPEPQLVTQRVIQNAEIVTIGNLLPGQFDDMIMLAMSPDDATIMRWLIDASIPFTLEPVEPE